MKRLVLAILFVAVAGSELPADTLTGEVRGAVLDTESRTRLAGVTMTLVNVDRGWSRKLPTDATGNYAFIQLEPGNYTVLAEIDGYYSSQRTNVLIRLNRPKVVLPPFELRKLVPTPTQQVTLRGEQTKTAVIDLTAPGPTPVILAFIDEPGLTSMASLLDASLRFNFDPILLQNLPLRGRPELRSTGLAGPGRVPGALLFGPGTGGGHRSGGGRSILGQRLTRSQQQFHGGRIGQQR